MCQPNCVATLDAEQMENIAFFDQLNLLTKKKLNVENVEMQTKCNYINANVVDNV